MTTTSNRRQIHLTLSILYLRCTGMAPARRHRVSKLALSILYLRCAVATRIRRSGLRRAFQFSIWDALYMFEPPDVDVNRLYLSILYLRCIIVVVSVRVVVAVIFQFSIWDAQAGFRTLREFYQPFNSLFEMRSPRRWYDGRLARKPFNSLFEMPAFWRAFVHIKNLTFNSLFEMPVYWLCFGQRAGELCFQFSIWDARGHRQPG